MFKRSIRFWAIAATAGVLVLAVLFGRVLVSAAYVNVAAILLTHAAAQSQCTLGVARFDLNPAQRERASGLLADALAWHPTNGRAWRLLGEIALNDNDLTRASDAFGRVDGQGITNDSSRFWQAFIQTEQGQSERAQPTWTTPGAEPFLIALGDCFITNDSPAQAQRYFTIARDNAGSVVAYTRLGDIALEADRLDDAVASYQYVIDHADDPAFIAGANLGMGRVLLRQDDANTAEQQFEAAFANNRSAAMASRIAIVLRRELQYERSNLWLQRWAELAPDSSDPYRVMGANALDMGQPEQAIELFNGAIRRGGQGAQLYYDLGMAYERTGDTTSARLAYKRVLAINPNHANARERLQALN